LLLLLLLLAPAALLLLLLTDFWQETVQHHQPSPFLAHTTTLSPASRKSSASARPTPNTI
jgi:hypothetical protein